MDQQQLLAAYGVLKNQSASLELQQKIVDSNNQIIDSHNQVLNSNKQLLAAQNEAEKKAILGKFTDLLMEGVASDYEDPVFRKKVGLFLSSPAGYSHKGAVLEQIADIAPSLFPVWIDAFKDISIQGSYGDLVWHPVEIAVNKYRYGFKKIPKDPQLEFKWVKKGAELGIIVCMITLSYRYMDGEHGEINYAESEKWSKLLAEAGEGCGFRYQARLYSEGLGRKKDTHKAKEILLNGLKEFSKVDYCGRRSICKDLIQLEDAWTNGSEDEHYSVYKGCFFENDFKGEDVWEIIDIEKYVRFHRNYLDKLKDRKDDLISVLNYLSIALPAFPESKHRDALLAQVTSINAEEYARIDSLKSEEKRKEFKKNLMMSVLGVSLFLIMLFLTR